MKCTKCGSNLEIDHEFCPYCGMPNPVARKHREDMKKYAGDYERTKETVVTKSRKTNRMSIRIAVISLTVAAVIGVVVYCAIADSLRRDHFRNIAEKEVDENVEKLLPYIENNDYLTVNEMAAAAKLRSLLTFDHDCYDVVRVSDSFSDLFMEIMAFEDDNGEMAEQYARQFANCINDIGRIVNEKKDRKEPYAQYMTNIKQDTVLMLKTYLNMSEEAAQELFEMTDVKRENALWEVIHAIQEQK